MVHYRDRDTLQLLVVGLAAIAAISLAAASIQSPALMGNGQAGEITIGSGLDITDPGEQVPPTDTNVPEVGTPNEGFSVGALTTCIPFLASGAGALLYFGALGGVLYGIKRRFSFGTALLSVYGLLPVALTGYFLTTSCNVAGGSGSGPRNALGPTLDTLAETGIVATVSPVWLLGGVGLLAVGAAAVLYRATGDRNIDAAVHEPEATTDETTDPADLAAAAGMAAERLAEHDADVDNEVYRAWYEMTSLLSVPSPETSTPGEFADAAVEVGMNREDVDELTTLFEEVRYGKRDPESREELALDVFRGIEAAYGDE